MQNTIGTISANFDGVYLDSSVFFGGFEPVMSDFVMRMSGSSTGNPTGSGISSSLRQSTGAGSKLRSSTSLGSKI